MTDDIFTELDPFSPDYEMPKSDKPYMKLADGKNKFRILASPISGWLYWDKTGGQNKPVRLRLTEENRETASLNASRNPDPKDQKEKYFWAMKVWNFTTARVEILELTQKGIISGLRSLSQEEDWGSPVDRYNLSIEKTGKEKDTRYTVNPMPHSKLSEDDQIMAYSAYVDLDALFYSQDPFDPNWKAKAKS